MCRGRIQWWQSRKFSAAPVAGWTSSAGEGSTASAGLFHNGVYVIVSLHVVRDSDAQESEWLHCSHSAVHDGEWGESRGVSPEVHSHLHSFERLELQVVKTAPDSQLLNLMSVIRLVTILDEADQCGVICKLQELDRRIRRGEAKIEGSLDVQLFVYREKSSGESTQPWGAPVLIVRVLDVYFPSLTSCCLSVRKLLVSASVVTPTDRWLNV